MRAVGKLAAIVLAPGTLVGVLGVCYTAIELYGQGRCASLVNCLYASHLAVFIGSLVLACSATGFLVAGLTQWHAIASIRLSQLALLVVAMACLQVVMFFGLALVTFGESDATIAVLVAWAAISGAACGIGLAAIRRLAPNNSSKPTPLRGAA